MSKKTEEVLYRFENGYNCGQAVLTVFSDSYGENHDTMVKLGCGLGSGFRCGELCGAASGAILAMGLKTAPEKVTDKESAQNCNKDVIAFTQEFQKIVGSSTCTEILGATPEEKSKMSPEEIKEKFRPTCKKMVVGAVEILERMGY